MMTLRAISKTMRHHIYAAGAGLLFAAVTLKVFWWSDAATATALAGEYSSICIGVPAFVAVAIGLQRFGPQPGPYDGRQRQGDDHGP
jgi:hypothetical protein